MILNLVLGLACIELYSAESMAERNMRIKLTVSAVGSVGLVNNYIMGKIEYEYASSKLRAKGLGVYFRNNTMNFVDLNNPNVVLYKIGCVRACNNVPAIMPLKSVR